MKKILLVFVIIMLALQHSGNSFSWGFFAHKKINRMAVFTLPPEMIGFYKEHILFIEEHATDPDKRRCCDTTEAARHYLDCDHYGAHPFDSIPHRWEMAASKYSKDTLEAYGILPWNVERVFHRLTEAFKNLDANKILRCSSDLGHYVADAHVPLHTTENYNGQLTHQKGIHAFWESRLPELFSDNYDYLVGRAQYVEHPLEVIWKTIQESYAAKDSVLLLEAQLNKGFSPDKKYSLIEKGRKTITAYSEEYSTAYNRLLNGMVERRLRASILLVSSLWYTAWVNAGQPELERMETILVMDSLQVEKERKIRNDREE